MRRLWVLVVCGGCLAGVPVRSAETTPRGETRLLINVTLAGYADGRVVANGVVTHGNAIWKLPPFMQVLVTAFHITGADVTWSTGLNGDCEVGARISLYRVGGEGRCGVHDDRTAVAGSVELAVPWLMGSFAVDNAWLQLDPWMRLGLEASDRRGERLLMAAVHLTYGPENAAVPIPDTVSGSRPFEGPSAYAMVRRRELRLTEVVAAGIDPESDDGPDMMTLGVVPYQVLHAGAPRLKCPVCRGGVDFHDFRLRRGVTIVGGVVPF